MGGPENGSSIRRGVSFWQGICGTCLDCLVDMTLRELCARIAVVRSVGCVFGLRVVCQQSEQHAPMIMLPLTTTTTTGTAATPKETAITATPKATSATDYSENECHFRSPVGGKCLVARSFSLTKSDACAVGQPTWTPIWIQSSVLSFSSFLSLVRAARHTRRMSDITWSSKTVLLDFGARRQKSRLKCPSWVCVRVLPEILWAIETTKGE